MLSRQNLEPRIWLGRRGEFRACELSEVWLAAGGMLKIGRDLTVKRWWWLWFLVEECPEERTVEWQVSFSSLGIRQQKTRKLGRRMIQETVRNRPSKMRIQLMCQECTMCGQVASHSHNALVTMRAERKHLVPVRDHASTVLPEWNTVCPLHLRLSRFEICGISKRKSGAPCRKRQCSGIWLSWIAALTALYINVYSS